jgi:hypothetical protein
MKRIITLSIFVVAIITAVLYMYNTEEMTDADYYKMGFTILFEAIAIMMLGVAASFKEMDFKVRLVYLGNIVLGALGQFFLLYFAPKVLNIKFMSGLLTTIILIVCAVEIGLSFLIYAGGNVFKKD